VNWFFHKRLFLDPQMPHAAQTHFSQKGLAGESRGVIHLPVSFSEYDDAPPKNQLKGYVDRDLQATGPRDPPS